MSLRVFIVDDDPDYADLLRFQVKKCLSNEADIHVFHQGEDALAQFDPEPDLVLLDLVMPGQGGLETLRQIKAEHADVPVVVASSQTVVSVALEALSLGAYDYITKGHDDVLKIRTIAQNIAEKYALSSEVMRLREQLPGVQGLEPMIGESASMARVLKTIQKTLKGGLTVAIVGESGTGKELVSRAIHFNSARRREPFVVVNCAAIPHELMESEFFGHEKGSFTGAYNRKIGKFEQANRGTIFLDEIGELDLSLQAKLLRVLQNQEVQRIGSQETLRVDVRVICATNQDVPALIEEGKFREDLYYRLFQFPVYLPPLRERDQDALLLAEFFHRHFLSRHPDVESRPLGGATRRFILEYDWPGNVRQLKNAVERALLISDTPEIIPDDLMINQAPMVRSPRPVRPAAAAPPVSSGGLVESVGSITSPEQIVPLEELKKQAVLQAYAVCNGNVDQTSIRLGVTRSTIYRLLEKYKADGEIIPEK